MSQSKQAGQSFALPTFLAAMMLVGIVAVALQLTIARQRAASATALTATAQASHLARPPSAAPLPGAGPASFVAPKPLKAAAPPPPATSAVTPRTAASAVTPKATPVVSPQARVSVPMPQVTLPAQPAAAVPPADAAAPKGQSAHVLPAATPLPAPPAAHSGAHLAAHLADPAPAAALSPPPPAPPVTRAEDHKLASNQTPPAQHSASPAAPAARPVPAVWVVVRPGQTLWEIAREHYGRGSDYAAIFRANRDQIANAALLHPGQRLRLPALSRQTGSDTAVVVRPGQPPRNGARRAYGNGGGAHASYRANRSPLTTPGVIHPGQVPSPSPRVVATG